MVFIDKIKEKQIEELLRKYGKIKLSSVSPELLETGKEIIDNLDLSKVVFDGDAIRFDDIATAVELVNYLTSREKNRRVPELYMSHYTNFDVAKKIIMGRKLQLGNPANMNDGLEFSSPHMDSSKLYFASFSLENSENMGMWSMYGQPWENGVKISIPKKAFISWLDSISKVYHVNPKTNEIITSDPIESGQFKASISRVAYVEWDDEGNVVQIRCGENSRNNRLKEIESQFLTGLIKDAAWSYEKEIRLRVDLERRIDDKKVAIDIPDEIYKNMIITTGPRFDKLLSSHEFGGIAGIKKSIFTDKLKYVYCDKCKSF